MTSRQHLPPYHLCLLCTHLITCLCLLVLHVLRHLPVCGVPVQHHEWGTRVREGMLLLHVLPSLPVCGRRVQYHLHRMGLRVWGQ